MKKPISSSPRQKFISGRLEGIVHHGDLDPVAVRRLNPPGALAGRIDGADMVLEPIAVHHGSVVGVYVDQRKLHAVAFWYASLRYPEVDQTAVPSHKTKKRFIVSAIRILKVAT